MNIPASRRLRVFISSTERDRRYLLRLQEYLAGLELAALVSIWSYEQISPGAESAKAIQEAIAAADLLIFLVSVDFLNSPYFQRDWLLVASRAKEEIDILPVYVGYCDLTFTPFSGFQAINSPQTPITSMSEVEQEKFWLRLASFVSDYARKANATSISGETRISSPPARDADPHQFLARSKSVPQEEEDLVLTGSLFEELVQALLSAFPRLSDLEMLISFKLDENFEAIASQQNLAQATFTVVNWARSTGKVRLLVRGASERNPGNTLLKSFVRKYL